MGELASFTVDEKALVVFEIDNNGNGIEQVGLGRKGKVLDTQEAFESKLSGIRDAASAALSVLKEDLRPDAVTLRFGIKMTVEAGAVIARTAVEGNMEVEMSWHRNEATEPAETTAPKSSE